MGQVVPLFRKYAPVYCVCETPTRERIALFDTHQCGVCKRPFKIVGDASTREGEGPGNGAWGLSSNPRFRTSSTPSSPPPTAGVAGDSAASSTPSELAARDRHPSAWRRTHGSN